MDIEKCDICPRGCMVNRKNGQIGACGVDDRIYVSRAALHMWEEPCISGDKGSGTVFFAGCPLGCIYCQNYAISHGLKDIKTLSPVSVEKLSEIFIDLQNKGANNINLVTPSHYAYQIIEAVRLAKDKGLILPIVYNCSGYEKVETLKDLEGTVDIYLTDFKYYDKDIAGKYSRAFDYPEIAKLALKEMVRQQPRFEFTTSDSTLIESEMMTKGVIVRNLLLPGHVNNSKDIIDYIYNEYGDRVYLSLMSQYTPVHKERLEPPLDRKVTKREYKRLVDYVISIGAKNVFIQEGDVSSESFIPDFDN